MKIIQDRLLLQQNDTKQKTASGIDLPESLQQKTFKVITTGPGVYNMAGKLVPPPVKEGNNVIIANGGNCGVEITLNGDKYRLIKSDDVLVIL
jgi:chaperonin GroES